MWKGGIRRKKIERNEDVEEEKDIKMREMLGGKRILKECRLLLRDWNWGREKKWKKRKKKRIENRGWGNLEFEKNNWRKIYEGLRENERKNLNDNMRKKS